MAAAAGAGFCDLPVDIMAEVSATRGRALRDSTTAGGSMIRAMSFARPLAALLAADLLKAARDSDVLLVSGTLAPLGHTIAAGLRLPSMGVFLQPVTPTGEFPPVFGTRSLGSLGNRLAGWAANIAVGSIYSDANRGLREQLGLPPASVRKAHRTRERQLWPVCHGFSPAVVPRPRDWRPGLSVVGYWWPYYQPQPLPPPLAEFLAAGPPPVFVCLGSVSVPDPVRFSAMVVSALRAAGLRGVFQRGWAGLHAEGDDMHTVDEIPHALLFSQMAAIIHHGGAGTTAAGLRAGIPAIPVPIQLDAVFWAARLAALGVSPGVIPLRRLTAQALTAALVRATTDLAYQQRATELATRIRAEDAITPVLNAINQIAGR
jgi:hypothetical protein